jgi:hypothetical protein
MVPVLSLAIPILVAAVLVFLASFILHMVLPYHRTDLRKTPKEDEIQEAFRRFGLSPGDYAVPCAQGPAGMKDPQFIERMTKGPVVLMTVQAGRSMSMASSLAQWFAYSILVGVFAAYVTGRALGPGANYLEVFRFAGTTAFVGYSLALPQHSIWYKRNWGTTLKSMFDGLVYGLLTAGAFGWLWPN